jgi:biotin carboxylase
VPFVIYATSWFPETAVRIIAAIAGLPDVRLAVVSQDPLEALPADLQPVLAGHWRVDDLLDTRQIVWATRELSKRHGPVERLFGAQEQTQVPLAEAREQLGIEGMRVETAHNFRDKARMKELLRAAGIPCARYRLVSTHDEAWRFVEEVGYPIVAKPPAGAASQTTYRADEPATLQQALDHMAPAPDQPVLLEEFITGDEHSLDTFSLDGQPLWHSLTHYHPTPLEVLQNPWIQWVVLLPREVDDARYDDIKALAARALAVLGMQTGLTHLEPPAGRADHDADVTRERVRQRQRLGAADDLRPVRPARAPLRCRRRLPACAGPRRPDHRHPRLRRGPAAARPPHHRRQPAPARRAPLHQLRG